MPARRRRVTLPRAHPADTKLFQGITGAQPQGGGGVLSQPTFDRISPRRRNRARQEAQRRG